MELKLARIMPDFDKQFPQKWYDKNGADFTRKYIGEIKVLNERRLLDNVNEGDPILFAINHTSLEDCVVPHLAILKIKGPWPRSIVNPELDRVVYKPFFRFFFGLDFRNFGVLFNGQKPTNGNLQLYTQALAENFRQGNATFVCPQGTRNGEDYKAWTFRSLLDVQEIIGRTVKVACIGLDYDRTLEGGRRPVNRIKDLISLIRWNYIKDRGKVRVNFGKPFAINEIAPDVTDKRVKAREIRNRTQEYIEQLVEEAQSYRER